MLYEARHQLTGTSRFNASAQFLEGGRWHRGSAERLTESSSNQFVDSISPDAGHVLVREVDPGSDFNLSVLSLSERVVEPLLASSFNELNGEVSPDGRWLTYQSDESGRYEIYLRPFPDVERFLVIRERATIDDAEAGVAIQIVLNWFEELERLAPPN